MEIRRHVLSDGDVSVAILSLGCITQDWRVPVNGTQVPAVLGYEHPHEYLHNPCFLGAIVGRLANRVSGAAFEWEGTQYELPVNEAPNHLHGGSEGLHSQNWTMEADGNRAVQLCLTSKHGDQGYPGRLELTVTVSLSGHCLTYDMQAISDRPTPVNLAQHSYYALGQGDSTLQIPAREITPVDDRMIPLGHITSVHGKVFDFSKPRWLSKVIQETGGLDMNFVLDGTQVVARDGQLTLELETDQPCLQLYTGQFLKRFNTPLEGQSHIPFSGFCLEPQGYPNAVNTCAFPTTIATPDHPYRQRLSVTIREENS